MTPDAVNATPPQGEAETSVALEKATTVSSERLAAEPPHPIAHAIDRFIHRVRDIEVSARVHVPLSLERKQERLTRLLAELREGSKLLKTADENIKAHAIRKVSSTLRQIDRVMNSSVPQALQTSLFLGLFSAYDAFTGELLSAIYRRKPELFRTMKRTVEVGEILKYKSFQELQESILQEVIEAFRRKSYVEQFADLEATFGLTLRAFDKWPEFVESGQRRNLVTHCDQIVSDQYIQVCKEHGVKLDKEAVVGERIGLKAEYFLGSCELMLEVGVKLGQTLWRKIFPQELEEADRHIQGVAYRSLQDERWDRAEVFAKFAATQRRIARDLDRRMAIINWAIALKFGGYTGESENVLKSEDWTASLKEFPLAIAVLQDRYADAADLMRTIGKAGELIDEHAYHDWPLFHEFRGRSEFLQAYQDLYGRPFIDQLTEAVAQTKATSSASQEFEGNEAFLEARSTPELTGEVISTSVDVTIQPQEELDIRSST